jgi:hypothetical protein
LYVNRTASIAPEKLLFPKVSTTGEIPLVSSFAKSIPRLCKHAYIAKAYDKYVTSLCTVLVCELSIVFIAKSKIKVAKK